MDVTTIGTINKDLPEDIRIFGLKRVTKGFNAKNTCQARTYSYTLPTIAFAYSNDPTAMRDFRLSAEKLSHINELLRIYKGSRKFHNFTEGKQPYDPSAIRQIHRVECDEPFLVDDVEFCVIRIRGNSFMIHQIRKMIGVVIAVSREVIDSGIFRRAFSDSPIVTPMVPGLGLVLDHMHYDKYDKIFGSDGLRGSLTWSECDEVVRQFREKYIHSYIVRTEVEDESMLQWLEMLPSHRWEVSSYRQSDELISESANGKELDAGTDDDENDVNECDSEDRDGALTRIKENQ